MADIKKTPEMIARFREMYFSGATWLAMSDTLDVNSKTLSTWAMREKFGPRNGLDGRAVQWTPEKEAELRTKEHGMSHTALARHFGLSIDAVKNKLHRMGLARVVSVKVDTYTGSPAWFRAQFGGDPLPPMHPIACEVLGLSA